MRIEDVVSLNCWKPTDNPAHVGIAKAIAEDLRQSGFFSDVAFLHGDGSARRSEADLILGGELKMAKHRARMLNYLIGFPAGALFALGFPLGYSIGQEVELDLTLRSAATNEVVWQHTIDKTRRQAICGWWWGNVYQFADGKAPALGFVTRLVKQGMSEALISIDETVQTKGEAYWASLKLPPPVAVATSLPVSPPQQRRSTPAKPSGVPRGAVRNVHVLVIGIESYEDANIPRLKYAKTDAEAVHGFFVQSDLSPARRTNVHFVGDSPNADGIAATKSGIMEAIERYLVREATHSDDMALLYFTGHGDTDRAGESYYLVPRDAKLGYLRSTAISLAEFQGLWDRIPARNRVLIADACNSGGFSGTKNLSIRGIEALPQQQTTAATVVLTACSANQKSLESDRDGHGLFTQVLLEGLGGKADDLMGDRDGRVSLAELRSWLEKVVPERAAKAGGRQTPVVKIPAGSDTVCLTK